MGYLDRYQLVNALVDIGVDDDLSEEFDMVGFEVVGIITPAALDGAANDVTLQIDPGHGTFLEPMSANGSNLTWWNNVSANEYLQVDTGKPPLVGAKGRLSLSAAETGDDRLFRVLLVALPGSSD